MFYGQENNCIFEIWKKTIFSCRKAIFIIIFIDFELKFGKKIKMWTFYLVGSLRIIFHLTIIVQVLLAFIFGIPKKLCIKKSIVHQYFVWNRIKILLVWKRWAFARTIRTFFSFIVSMDYSVSSCEWNGRCSSKVIRFQWWSSKGSNHKERENETNPSQNLLEMRINCEWWEHWPKFTSKHWAVLRWRQVIHRDCKWYISILWANISVY